MPSKLYGEKDEQGQTAFIVVYGGPGDSGRPALVRKDDKAYLVGVSHASMGGKPGRCGVSDIFTRVSSYVDWIDGVSGTKKLPSIGYLVGQRPLHHGVRIGQTGRSAR